MKASIKKATNVALAAALLSGAWATTASANGIEFTDIPLTNVHYDNIYNLTNRAVITGYPDGTYQPARHLTRAEAAVILFNALGFDTTDSSDPGFSDVKKGTWYYEEVAVLANYGILSGYNDGKFGPNDKLTRAQMASILTNAYNLYTADYVETPFTDVVEGSWYDEYVQALYYFEVTSGVSQTKYAPKDYVRRDAMASFVVNSETVTTEQKDEMWMHFYGDMYNTDDANPIKVSVNTDANTITLSIDATTKTVKFMNDAEIYHMLLPIYESFTSTIKGQSRDLSIEYAEDTNDLINAILGVTDTTDLNDLHGKSVTFTFEDYYGNFYDYTVEFQNN